jgi:hypothetical protein
MTQDLIDRLGSLGDGTGMPNPATIEADLRRGRAELGRRRRRQGTAGLAAAAAVAIAGVSVSVASGGGTKAHPQSGSAVATTKLPIAGTTVKTPSTTVAPSHKPDPYHRATTRLVAYTGRQLAGFTVSQVPAGYVLQGAQPTTLDIAEPNDHTSIDSFINKLVVSLQSHDASTPTTGTRVTVNGQPGIITESDGVRVLTYKDGKYEVDVECWTNIHLTDSQLVAFAEGVTVTSAAQQSYG